jgi:hypothetical protein
MSARSALGLTSVCHPTTRRPVACSILARHSLTARPISTRRASLTSCSCPSWTSVLSSVVSMSCTSTARSSCVLYAFIFAGPLPQLCFSASVIALEIVIAAGPSMAPRTGARCRFLAAGDASGFVALTASRVTAIRTPFYGSGGRKSHPSGPGVSRATRTSNTAGTIARNRHCCNSSCCNPSCRNRSCGNSGCLLRSFAIAATERSQWPKTNSLTL